MTPRPLIKTQPCHRCDDLKTVHDLPPYDVCVGSLTGDFECPKVFAADEIAEHASTCAQGYAVMRHTPQSVRREMAEADAGKYEEAAQDLGAEFDAEEFISRCCPVKVPA